MNESFDYARFTLRAVTLIWGVGVLGMLGIVVM